jgi:O-antigen/teichoic acid export membrane protein
LKSVILLGLKSTPIAISSISKQQSDGLIIAITQGPVAVSILYTSKVPIILCVNLIHSIITTMTPAVNQMHAQKQTKNLHRTFQNLHRVNFLLSSILVFGLLLFHERFTDLWVGVDQYAGAYVTIIFSLTILFTTTYNVNFQFIYARGEIQFLSFLSFCETLIGLLLAYVISQIYGVAGVVTVMMFMSAITSSYVWYITFRSHSLNAYKFLRASVLAPVVAVTISAVLTDLCAKIPSVGNIVIEIIVFMLFSCLTTYLIVLTKRDKALMRRFLKRSL